MLAHRRYHLYMKTGDKFLLAAKKRTKNRTSNYLISLSKADMSKAGPNYVGKLRSNFIGTEFVVYDRGMNPKRGEGAKGATMSQIRRELGACQYASNILGSRGPRKMKVCVPSVERGEIVPWRLLCKVRGSAAAGVRAERFPLSRLVSDGVPTQPTRSIPRRGRRMTR